MHFPPGSSKVKVSSRTNCVSISFHFISVKTSVGCLIRNSPGNAQCRAVATMLSPWMKIVCPDNKINGILKQNAYNSTVFQSPNKVLGMYLSDNQFITTKMQILIKWISALSNMYHSQLGENIKWLILGFEICFGKLQAWFCSPSNSSVGALFSCFVGWSN